MDKSTKDQYLKVGSIWASTVSTKSIEYVQVLEVGDHVRMQRVIPSLFMGMWTPSVRGRKGNPRQTRRHVVRFYEEFTIVQVHAAIDPPWPEKFAGEAWVPIPYMHLKFVFEAAAQIPGMGELPQFRSIANALAALDNSKQITGKKLWAPEGFTSKVRRPPSYRKQKSSGSQTKATGSERTPCEPQETID